MTTNLKMKFALLGVLCALAVQPARAYTFTNVAIGTTPGDGTGDPAYIAFTKVNQDLYWMTNYLATNNIQGVTISVSIVVSSVITNSVLTNDYYAGNGYYVTNLNGTNLLAGTVPLTAFQVPVPSNGTNFYDTNSSTGTAGYIPVAQGTGGWLWTAPNVVPDSGGFGGTTLELNASDNGSAMYIHVTSLGVITATSSP